MGQLSLEFLVVTALLLTSCCALSALSSPSRSPSRDQPLALLIDDLSSFGSPFTTDEVLIDVELKEHRLGNATTATEKLLSVGGYRYRTHSIKGTYLP